MSPPTTYQARKPVASLNAATANGNGGGANVSGYNTIAIQSIENSVTAGTVTLELSLDGETWHATSTTIDLGAAASGAMAWSVDTPATYARAALTGFTGTDVTVYISGA